MLPIFQGGESALMLLQTSWASLLNPLLLNRSGSSVSLAGENYLTINGSVITAHPINLATSNVIGNLSVSHLNSGTGASSSTFWRGDGTWATTSGSGDVNQGGNSFGTTMTIGTLDNQDFDLIRDGFVFFEITGAGRMILGHTNSAGQVTQNNAWNAKTLTIQNDDSHSTGLVLSAFNTTPPTSGNTYGAFINLVTLNQHQSQNISFESGNIYAWSLGIDNLDNGTYKIAYQNTPGIPQDDQIDINVMNRFFSIDRNGKHTIGNFSWSFETHVVQGNLAITPAGSGLRVSEGSNARMGLSTLVGGTIAVSNTSVTANSRIFLMHQNVSGTAGFLVVSARTAATSFTILSSDVGDTSDIAWILIEPA